MNSNPPIENLLERIQSSLREFKSETKQQFTNCIDQENWKAVAVLNDCASWIEDGIDNCGRLRMNLDSSAEGEASVSVDEQESVRGPRSSGSSSPEKSSHPFWPIFFAQGVPFHPELENKTPTGGGRKIGPTILPGIQIDVAYSTRGVSCRLLSGKPEKLKPLLKLKERFAAAVDGEIEWNDGNKNRSHLSVTVRPASNLEQQSWSIEEKAGKLLRLYGQIKMFILENLD